MSACPRFETIYDIIATRAAQDAAAAAFRAPGRSPMSFGSLKEQADDVAAVLNGSSVGRGDRVAIVLPNGPEMASAFACIGASTVTAPLNPAYRAQEFEFYLSDLEAKALVVSEGDDSPAVDVARRRGIGIFRLKKEDAWDAGRFTLLVEPPAAPANQPGHAGPDDTVLILHTSGTTSRPKMVPLTQANVCASACNVRESLGLLPSDLCLNVMPLFHIHGLVAAVLASLVAGGSVVCTPGFFATDFFGWVESHEPTWYTAVPTMHQAILSRSRLHTEVLGRHRLRFVRSSSSALPPRVLEELEGTFRVPVVEAYGMTEAAHQVASNPLPPRPRKLRSVGLAAGPEVAIMDEGGRLVAPGVTGEIVIRGSNVTHGYLNSPAAGAQAFTAGWFRTGDQGCLDEDGYLFITGRIKEIINRGGEKISPREIDEALLEHPAVAQAVAFAVPHDTLGEDVAAAVVPRDNAVVSKQELKAFVAERLSLFKVPQSIVFLEAIPKGPTGKLQRIGLAETLGLTGKRAGEPAAHVAPRTPTEADLERIWSRVLRVDRVSATGRFLDLGGDSMLITRLAAGIREKFGLEISLMDLFNAQTISSQAALVEALLAQRSRQDRGSESSMGLDTPRIPRAGGELASAPASGPLSLVQRRLWALHHLAADPSAFNRTDALRLAGPLDRASLGKALQEIVNRHDSLRSYYVDRDGEPEQIVAKEAKLTLTFEDHTGKGEEEITGRMIEERRRVFDLAQAPLLRALLMATGPDRYLMCLTMHHLVGDGYSMGVFYRELSSLYAAFLDGRPAPLEKLPAQYLDFARWQRQHMAGPALQPHLAYWKTKLENLPVLELPADYPRPAVQSQRGAWTAFEIPRDLADRLQAFSRDEGVTLFMTLLGAFKVLLGRYSGQDDIAVGIPVAGRTRTEFEKLIGPFATTPVLRTDLGGEATFREVLRRVRKTALEAFDHQEVPYEKIVEELKPEMDPSHTPFFQTLFNLRNYDVSLPAFPRVAVESASVPAAHALTDLYFNLHVRDGALQGEAIYCADLFERETVVRLTGHYLNLLRAILAAPDRPVASLPMISESERKTLVSDWNDTGKALPEDRLVHELFEEQVRRSPDAPALVFGNERLSYAELNSRSNRLARRLRAAGVGPEVVVGVMMEVSTDLVVSLLAILKAGGAYLPLDPHYPAAHNAFMLEDACAPFLLTRKGGAESLPPYAGHVLLFEELAEWLAGSPENLERITQVRNRAYVIYTSGSTGKPKGVEIEHRSVVNFVVGYREVPGVTAKDAVLAVASFSFDMAVCELFVPLSAGASVIAVDRETVRDSMRLSRAMESATLVMTTPSMWRLLVDQGWRGKKGLRVVCAGEVLPRGLASELLQRADEVWNSYGPTETTVISSSWRVPEGDGPISIGRPAANTRCYVLDGHGNLQPAGIPGELYIGGAAVGRGYLRRPDLTSERFLADPFSPTPGGRMYRSGDRVRWTRSGALECLGRIDRQVKLRGFRIEPGEIESVLELHDGVRTAHVESLRGPDGPELVAYYIAFDPVRPGEDELRAFVGQKLPWYMVPSAYVRLTALPMTPNGKVDSKRLPAPDLSRQHDQTDFVAPRSPTESVLVDIWRDVFGIERVGSNDSFLGLGGHSLTAMRVVSRIRTQLGVDVPFQTIFEHLTIAELANRIDAQLAG